MDNATIYLDHAATSPIRAEARAAIDAVFDDASANPSSSHRPGARAAGHVATAATTLARVIGAEPETIVWTSGATEATNLALRGVAGFAGTRGASHAPVRVVSCVTEHAATRDLLKHMARRGEIVVDWLEVDGEGRLDLAALDGALARAPALVSLMQVNNETGLIHDIADIAARCAAAAVPLHVDAAQSLGRLAIDVARTPIALMSMSAHKLGGPPGVGALYVRKQPRVGLAAQIIGGGQQGGRRAGTLPVHQIAGFAAALGAVEAERPARQRRYAELRDRLWARLARIDGVARNSGVGDATAAPFLNVSVAGVHGEALRTGLAYGEPGVAVSGGSACSAARGESSPVLRAMGRSPEQAAASLRFSLGPGVDVEAIDAAAARVADEIARLRQMGRAL